jgi:hypothetical protein
LFKLAVQQGDLPLQLAAKGKSTSLQYTRKPPIAALRVRPVPPPLRIVPRDSLPTVPAKPSPAARCLPSSHSVQEN